MSAAAYSMANSQATRANSKLSDAAWRKVKCRLGFRLYGAERIGPRRSRSYSLSRRASRPGSAGGGGADIGAHLDAQGHTTDILCGKGSPHKKWLLPTL